MPHVFLIGFMGAGKSTVARAVGAALARPVVDLDRVVESRSGLTIPEIFCAGGEQQFRDLESAALLSLANEPPSIVACGGGIVLRDQNRAILKTMGHIVYLRVSAGEALARIGDDGTRPLLSGPSGVLAATTLLEARESLYSAMGDVTIDTVGLGIEAVASAVVSAIKELEA